MREISREAKCFIKVLEEFIKNYFKGHLLLEFAVNNILNPVCKEFMLSQVKIMNIKNCSFIKLRIYDCSKENLNNLPYATKNKFLFLRLMGKVSMLIYFYPFCLIF